MKRLYLIRHAKSSWAEAGKDDFSRSLNARGKEDGPIMAKRLAAAGIHPDLIVSSPAKRAKKTAEYMAMATGYEKDAIQYDLNLYLGTLSYHRQVLSALFKQVDVLFLVGHNETMSELAAYLSGRSLGNVPTCGIVGLESTDKDEFSARAGGCALTLFWFPKDGETAEK